MLRLLCKAFTAQQCCTSAITFGSSDSFAVPTGSNNGERRFTKRLIHIHEMDSVTLPLRTYQERFSMHTGFCPKAQPTRACCEDLPYPKTYKPETISGMYSTAEQQPRGASTRSTARTSSRLYSTARGCSRLCSTARRCSRLYGSADTSIYWRPLIEKLALSASVPVFHRRTVVALAF